MEKPKTIMCSNCGEELSGNDKLYCNRIFDKRKQCKSIEEYRNLITEIAIRSVEDRMWTNYDD